MPEIAPGSRTFNLNVSNLKSMGNSRFYCSNSSYVQISVKQHKQQYHVNLITSHILTVTNIIRSMA